MHQFSIIHTYAHKRNEFHAKLLPTRDIALIIIIHTMRFVIRWITWIIFDLLIKVVSMENRLILDIPEGCIAFSLVGLRATFDLDDSIFHGIIQLIFLGKYRKYPKPEIDNFYSLNYIFHL
uniref:Uncharacterized protein n=1 Tax=Rhizophagus irregularis (strain DAOM 181602 / DAOM 197198 / MUCL 43194) TaxID=747089 RepID=U9TKX8_RHIID